MSGSSKEEERVVIHEYGVVEPEPLSAEWPSGDVFLRMLQDHGVELTNAQKDAGYWQTSARWALLRKYGYPELPAGPHPYEVHRASDGNEGSLHYKLVFDQDMAEAIVTRWYDVTNMSQDPECADENDLVQFLKSGKSNGRRLEWSIMNCAPGCQFNLHAHPNLELVYCAKGALHEVRMEGEPYTTKFAHHHQEHGKEKVLVGPNLTHLDRRWYFDTLYSGQWLVNEVGSIHKSFTATSGEGCLLIVLWGGSHANIVSGHEPHTVDVDAAVNSMDQRLGECPCHDWDRIKETFLPKSECSLKK